jgi:hypothetical protein
MKDQAGPRVRTKGRRGGGKSSAAKAKRKPKQPCPCGCGAMIDPDWLKLDRVTRVSIGIDGREIASFASFEEYKAFMDALRATDSVELAKAIASAGRAPDGVRWD